jgi:hypothetical protein
VLRPKDAGALEGVDLLLSTWNEDALVLGATKEEASVCSGYHAQLVPQIGTFAPEDPGATETLLKVFSDEAYILVPSGDRIYVALRHGAR